ncbi:MAG: hypothetical protein K8I60_21745 [Anaerolineae bacterium]|nr:hypothetical protein [Anaerolineae bacterium]
MNTLAITLSPRRTAWILGGISVFLCAVSIAGKALEWALGVHSTYFIYQTVLEFNVNRESNIPTWYSTLLLLTCAVLLGIIALAHQQSGKAGARYWKGLALIFLYLSLDETAVIHEQLTIPLQESLRVTGYLYFGWVLVGAAVVIAIGLVYARFIFRLPPPTRRLFILAALLYVGGALVVESISANQWYQMDGESLLFSAIGTLEELGEMLGAVVFIYALSTYIRDHVGEFRIGMIPAQSTS